MLLAIAVINDPDLIFLDEPTTGLDPQARRNFWELIRGIKARGKTVILSTHYMDEAYQLCDDIAIMDHGRIIARGSPTTLLSKYFKESILELPSESVRGLAVGLPVTERGGRIEITTANVGQDLRTLLNAGVSLTHLMVRPPTLEDLFLHLTGKELRA
jgi:ABC-2 type transport system ATP-binding protein